MSGVIIPLLLLIVLAVTLASCVSDWRSMRIPNLHTVIILAAFVMAYVVSPETFGKWWNPLGAFVLIFGVTFGMYAAGMIGSGDTKLGSALALWIGLKGLVVYLFYMTLMGGVLGIVAVWMKHKKPFANPPEGSWAQKAQSGKSVVPYGIAITVGFWGALFHTGLMHRALHELYLIVH
jgi:prepilin peptidase CpaA